MSGARKGHRTAIRPVVRLTAGIGLLAAGVLVTIGTTLLLLAVRMVTPQPRERTGRTSGSLAEQLRLLRQVAADPRSGFPGQRRIHVLCLGLDSQSPPGPAAGDSTQRTDTLFVASVDLDRRRLGILAIPRDTWVPLAGSGQQARINQAYSSGGAQRAVATVAALLGIRPDHYLVVSVDALPHVVDELGGVHVRVEHAMDYDDLAGGLSIHLRPGDQRLNGEQALAFARFRRATVPGRKGWLTGALRSWGIRQQEPRPIAHPEGGDQRRIYRQQVLLRALAQQAQAPRNLSRIPRLVDVALRDVETDLTRMQLFALAALLRHVSPNELEMGQLPCAKFTGPGGEAVLRPVEGAKRAHIDWLLRGDVRAARALTAVRVSAPDHEAATDRAVARLKQAGYQRVTVSIPPPGPAAEGAVIRDSGVAFRQAGRDIARLLGLDPAVVRRRDARPDGYRWPVPAEVTVCIGGQQRRRYGNGG